MLLALLQVRCTDDDLIEPTQQSKITEKYNHADASCSVNGYNWDTKCYLKSNDNYLTFACISEYAPLFYKSLGFTVPIVNDTTFLTLSDQHPWLYNEFINHSLAVVDDDAVIASYRLSGEYPLNSFIIIDSINIDTTYIKGRFSLDMQLDSNMTGNLPYINDSSLSEFLEIRNGRFEGLIYNKF